MNNMLDLQDTKVVENCTMKVRGGDRLIWDYVGKFTYGRVFDEGQFEARIDRHAVIKGEWTSFDEGKGSKIRPGAT